MSTRARAEEERNQRHGNESTLLTQRSGRTWPEWIAGVLLVVSFSFVEGFIGGLAGAGTAIVWSSLGTPYALATGVVFLTALTPDGIGSPSVMIAGAGLVVLLFLPTLSSAEQNGYLLATTSVTVTLSALTWLLLRAQPTWILATVLVGMLALFIYGLYRYQRLQLGLLDEEPPDQDRLTESITVDSDQ